MSIKSLVIAFMPISLALQVSALAIIGDRFPTSPKDLKRQSLTFECNVYSDSSCQDFIGSNSAPDVGQCTSMGGNGNSYLCFNVNDVSQVDFFFGSNCEDDTIITSQNADVGCTQAPQTIRSVLLVDCSDVDGGECP
jgi:hypothetical protein